MSTALTRIADATGFDRGKIEVIKDTVAKGASDDELIVFLSLAQRSGLDPFSRQIYLIERRQNVNGNWVTTRQPQTGIDGLRLIADRTGNYAPGRAPSYEYDADGKLFSATAYVMKYVRNQWHEVAATAHWQEYAQLKKDGTPTQMWADKPHIMLAKCAEALALRRAFPADMSGLYTADEMRDVNTATGEIIEAPRPVVAALPQKSERDLAIEAMRSAARGAKQRDPSIKLPTADVVANMSLEEIRDWTDVYNNAQPEEAEFSVEEVASE